jgi:glycosyltransferase involved in cell wall biosynthesis
MWQPGLVRVAASREFEQLILLANPYWIATWIGAIVGRLTGKRVIFWSHGFLTPPKGIKGLVRRVFHRLAHTHLFYGRTAKQIATASGWDPARIHVIGNSLDLDRQRVARDAIDAAAIAACRKALFARPELPTVICSCRLVAEKRIDLLLRAAEMLSNLGEPINVVIIGDGPERARLQEFVRSHQLSAHFEGQCYEEARIALLTMSSDLTVCPGFVGLTAIQSMAYGVPVITNKRSGDDAPEVEAIVPGLTGDLFEEGDADDLVAVMRSWLRRPSMGHSYPNACIEIIERYWSPDSQLRVLEEAVTGVPPTECDYPAPPSSIQS